jgi:hypothetical protein
MGYYYFPIGLGFSPGQSTDLCFSPGQSLDFTDYLIAFYSILHVLNLSAVFPKPGIIFDIIPHINENAPAIAPVIEPIIPKTPADIAPF